jgi:hypothetical protein
MPDIWLDVDTAITVHANKVPLVAKSDGTTISAAVAFNAAGMDINWNFVTTAGVATHTNVIPTSAGVHDWVALANGMYTMEIPASAGTVNNDTEGFGWWSGETTAEAAFISPIYGFRAAALNNALIDGGDELDVNVTKVADTAQTANDVGLDVQTMVDGIITGTAVTGTLSTTQATSDLTGYADDQLIGRIITWLGGAADGESTDITDYANASGLLTFTALTTAPANTDPFKIT